MNNSFFNLIVINSIVSQRGIFFNIFCVFKIGFRELYYLTIGCVA